MTTKKILTTMPNDGRPYVLESAAFRMSVHQYRQDAQREIDALDGEISRLQAELEARMVRRQDLAQIVILADMVLEKALSVSLRGRIHMARLHGRSVVHNARRLPSA